MWVKAQNGKLIIDCVGFDIGNHGFGSQQFEEKTIVYGVTLGTKGYEKIVLGIYKRDTAEKVLKLIKIAIEEHRTLYEMPKD